MIKVVTIENMRRIEAIADESGLTYAIMMDHAGQAISKCASRILDDCHGSKITILVGAGNNGGDGLVAARYLARQEDISVSCYLLKARSKTDGNLLAAKDSGVTIIHMDEDSDGKTLYDLLANADLIIDALFGIGVRLPIKGKAATILIRVNEVLSHKRYTSPPEDIVAPASARTVKRFRVPRVLAVDCPSGLDCDNGEVDDNVIPADETVTFIAAKPGLLTFPGANSVGILNIASIGVPSDLLDMQESKWSLAAPGGVRGSLPERTANSHKGTYGKALIVAGSLNYVGAPGLAAEGAYRAGAGLVTVGAPSSIVPALSARLPEPTWVMLPHDMGVISENAVPLVLEQCAGYQALLLGPGWGQEDATKRFIQQLLEASNITPKSPKKRRSIGFSPLGLVESAPDTAPDSTSALPPVVIDADGLNLLAEIDEWWHLLPEDTIVTPHPGEMSRLTHLTTKDIQSNRWAIAAEKAEAWNVVLLLKGAHTLIAAPDGQVTVLPFKTDGLATAGTGDILSGLIIGLLAQGMKPFDAAVAGGYIHGLAGELAQQHQGSGRSVIASDVLAMIPESWRIVENS